MSERTPYVRVYHTIVDDPKFATVYDDDRLLATWLRLLIVADQAHPASAHIPYGTNRTAVAKLTDIGLIDQTAGSRFRIHGLDRERDQRSEAARVAGFASGRSRTVERPFNGRSTAVPETPNVRSTENEPSKAKQSKAEQSKANGRDDDHDDGRADLEAFLLIHRRAPTPRQRQLLDGLLDRHDLTGPEWAADIMLRHPNDAIGAVIEADKAWRAERIAAAQAAEVPKPQPRRKASMPEASRELLAHWAAQKTETA